MPDAPTPPPEPRPDATEQLRRLARVTPAVAVAGVVLALVGLAVAFAPLRTPVQDCGTAGTFLLDGRVDVAVDVAHPPKGVTRAEARSHAADPCQERAADRARPAAMAIFAGTLAGLAAAAVEVLARLRWHRRAATARWLGGAPS